MEQTLFLFDVDGVLIYPKAYKEAMIATINTFADQMGQQPVDITYDEIAEFEAQSITNEWDSVAMCVALMLIDASTQDSSVVEYTFHGMLDKIKYGGVKVRRPDFGGFAREVGDEHKKWLPPSLTALKLLKKRTDSSMHRVLDHLLGDVYDIYTPTTRVFQNHTLGKNGFEETYREEAELDLPSFLLTYDEPHITKQNINRLRETHEVKSAIYTARPGRVPSDLPLEHHSGLNRAQYPPEADYAVDLLDMHDFPLIAGGRVAWLAATRNKHMSSYIKPSPVQALAAIGAAASGGEVKPLKSAADLVEDGTVNGSLAPLVGKSTHVVVFEDSTGGIEAVRDAVDVLRSQGMVITFDAVGVAKEPTKRQALEALSTRVVDNVNEGIEVYLL